MFASDTPLLETGDTSSEETDLFAPRTYGYLETVLYYSLILITSVTIALLFIISVKYTVNYS